MIMLINSLINKDLPWAEEISGRGATGIEAGLGRLFREIGCGAA